VFNNEYLTKLLISLVYDEGKRIVSSDLASANEFNGLLKSALRNVSNSKSALNKKMLLDTLSTLHNDLLKIKLPGDFKNVTAEFTEKLLLILDIPEENLSEKPNCNIHDILETKNDGIEEEREIIKVIINDEDKETVDEDKETIDEDKKKAKNIISKLQKIAHELGRIGDHSTAYSIERIIRKIK